MRLVAAIGLAWAAFDWPMPWLDRAGLAAIALALLALAIPARPRMQRPALFGPPLAPHMEPELDLAAARRDRDADMADDF